MLINDKDFLEGLYKLEIPVKDNNKKESRKSHSTLLCFSIMSLIEVRQEPYKIQLKQKNLIRYLQYRLYLQLTSCQNW
jgi:hypothetical protein